MARFVLLTPVLLLAVACGAEEPVDTPYDLVITNGRVVDPESGLDAVRTVAIRDGRVVLILDGDLWGDRTIDATGLVVAPGFIDLHEHGQNEESYALMVRDGVTSAFELEVGTGDVDAWYAEREPGQLVNFGVSIGHIPTRMAVLGDPGQDLLPSGIGGFGSASPEQIEEMEGLIRVGLQQGAVAVGFGSAYTPGAEMSEIARLFSVAAEYGAVSHIHMRGGLAGLDSTIAAARAARAPLHIVHANSSAGAAIGPFLEMIESARDDGGDVTTEIYPYGAGMTEIQSALFDDWESWPDEAFASYQLVSTGARATRETFARARVEGGTVIIHSRSEELTRAAVASPLPMFASDGFIDEGGGHPRTSGTYSKVLGRYVREQGVLSLAEAIRRMTLEPALRLQTRVREMALKGRIMLAGHADITIFDPETVIDRSTYEDAMIPADGIIYVIIAGEVVVDGGDLTSARPGRAIRARTSARAAN